MRSSLLTGLIVFLASSQAAIAETPAQQAEKDARRACEAKICDIVATRDQAGEDVTCDLVKTWSGAEITEILGDRVNWPLGSAMCQTKVTLERKPLARAMSEPSYEMTMPSQTVRCSLASNDDSDAYVIEFSAAPKVKFENGKAIEAQINWGKASAPALLYPLIYAGTAFDNSTNIFGPEVVRLVNDFTAKKCSLVKAALPGSARP
jgi:hypothetical protein